MPERFFVVFLKKKHFYAFVSKRKCVMNFNDWKSIELSDNDCTRLFDITERTFKDTFSH